MEKIYDMIVIGGGPAGYTAALYGARSAMDTIVLEKISAGGQMATTTDIDNYPGFTDGVDGFELGLKMMEQAEKFGATSEMAEVSEVELEGDLKKVHTDAGIFTGRTVVIATGANPRKLGIKDEEALTGRGIHYCAACDGMFYRGKTAAVIGGGNSAVADALVLAGICDKVYLVHRRDQLRASEIYHDQLEKIDNIEFVWNSTVESIINDEGFRGLRLHDRVKDEDFDLICDGAFVSIGRQPVTELFRGKVDIDGNGYIVAGESTETSVAGVYAAGDVRTKALRQVVTAAADGAVAAHYAHEHIHLK